LVVALNGTLASTSIRKTMWDNGFSRPSIFFLPRLMRPPCP
jgi:hypothetical protein